MDETEWGKYSHRNHDKCKDCTAHCGYEATAMEDSTNGLKNMVYSAEMVLM